MSKEEVARDKDINKANEMKIKDENIADQNIAKQEIKDIKTFSKANDSQSLTKDETVESGNIKQGKLPTYLERTKAGEDIAKKAADEEAKKVEKLASDIKRTHDAENEAKKVIELNKKNAQINDIIKMQVVPGDSEIIDLTSQKGMFQNNQNNVNNKDKLTKIDIIDVEEKSDNAVSDKTTNNILYNQDINNK